MYMPLLQPLSAEEPFGRAVRLIRKQSHSGMNCHGNVIYFFPDLCYAERRYVDLITDRRHDMKHIPQKLLSLLLVPVLACSLMLPAAASDALGEDLTAQNTLLNEETELSTNVFWSTAYSDLRTENVVTYTPNKDVTPIVTYGNVLTSRNTPSSMAAKLEAQGYRVVAGINGDFYNTSTGLPIGIVITEGELRSSDGGYYAIGFRADGTAVIGKPAVKVSADLGYEMLNDYGTPTEVIRSVTGVNKARVSTGGIYLYTYDFNDRHTTGNTEAGVDVVCNIEDGVLSIGDTLTVTVERVVEATSATTIQPGQIVLSANLLSGDYYVNALRQIPVGSTITLDVSASSEEWNDVEYAVGALYSLVENGSVVSGLAAGANPRTAIGQKADGTVVFYTIDGRKSGHSIGATMTQVAQRMVELGCVSALCLDGGGSTAMTVTAPDATSAKTINVPSDGGERAVTNQVFLVATNESTGRLSHYYVKADNAYVLAGSKVNITASAVDTNYIPMDHDYDLDASDGEMDGNVLTTPHRGGEITVTASGGGKKGSTTVYAITEPDSISVKNGSSAVTSLSVAPGASVTLTASAMYNHLALKADPEAFTWKVSGGIGTVSENGVFTATAPGTGTLTVSAGGKSTSVTITVSNLALQTVEDFEGSPTIFQGTGNGADLSLTSASDYVKLGRSAAKLDYTLLESLNYGAEWRAFAETDIPTMYTSLNMWVYGDGSGNNLYFFYSNGTKTWLSQLITKLDFTGWKQISVPITSEHFEIQGLNVSAGSTTQVDDGLGGTLSGVPTTPTKGTIYIDHIVASFNNTVDTTVPSVTVKADGTALTATISDAVDGVLPQSSITVTWDGKAQSFNYNAQTGVLSTPIISDGKPHRLTVTARDASGNIGRASYDVPAGADWKPSFTDTQNYWGATYVDYLYTAGITTGYDDGTFRPNQNITRAQFSVMLFRYLGLNEADYAGVTLPFADNASIPAYAVPAIQALYSEGIINGSTGSDGRLYFNPGASLTRAQAATMIGRTQQKGYATAALTFTDAASIPAYATYYIQTMVAQGVISGYTDGTFLPNAYITRGQMAKILYNLM